MTLRTGVIGAGVVASNNHFSALARNPKTSLVAIADRDGDRARDAAEEFGAVPYTDAADLLDEEKLDWVHVATPVQSHLDIARDAIESDVPVLLQKPATTTLRELEELRDLAGDRDVPVSVVHNWLYYPVMREVRTRLDRGEVGKIRAVETTVTGEGAPDETYRGSWVFDLPGGALEEGMPHPLYLSLATGGYPRDEEAIDVASSKVGEYDHDISYDGITLEYVTSDGTLCSVTYLADGARGTSVRIHGTDGSLSVDFPSMTVDSRDAEEGPYHFWNERFRRNVRDGQAAGEGAVRNLLKYGREYVEERFDRHLGESPDGHYYLIDKGAEALQAGLQPPRDLEESYWTLVLMEAVRERGGTAE